VEPQPSIDAAETRAIRSIALPMHGNLGGFRVPTAIRCAVAGHSSGYEDLERALAEKGVVESLPSGRRQERGQAFHRFVHADLRKLVDRLPTDAAVLERPEVPEIVGERHLVDGVVGPPDRLLAAGGD
jgi:hypothetical protein